MPTPEPISGRRAWGSTRAWACLLGLPKHAHPSRYAIVVNRTNRRLVWAWHRLAVGESNVIGPPRARSLSSRPWGRGRNEGSKRAAISNPGLREFRFGTRPTRPGP